MFSKKILCLPIRQRWILALFCFLGFFNAYAIQGCFPIALTEMVLPSKPDNVSDDSCQPLAIEKLREVTKIPTKIHPWSEKTQGLILSSFYWTYTIIQIPAGMMAEKYGGKHILGVGLLISAVSTLLIPLSIRWAGSTGLIICQLFIGLGQGVIYPSASVLLSKWIPPVEISRTGAFVYSAQALGSIFGCTGSGLIIHHMENVSTVFYVIGGITAAWYPFWLILCYNSPRQHPFISATELKELTEQLDGQKRQQREKLPPTPWRRILTSTAVWAAVIGLFGFDLILFTISAVLPKYVSVVLKFPVKIIGYLASSVCLSMWIASLVTAWLTDYAIERQFLSTTNARKFGSLLALFCSACFIVAAFCVGCNRTLVFVILTIAFGFVGAGYPSIMVNPLDISPNYSGSINALSNAVAAIFGGILPLYFTGVMTPNGTFSEWRTCSWIAFTALGMSNLFFLAFAKGDVQCWNDLSVETSEEEDDPRKVAQECKLDPKVQL